MKVKDAIKGLIYGIGFVVLAEYLIDEYREKQEDRKILRRLGQRFP